jgi:hypothetical protein
MKKLVKKTRYLSDLSSPIVGIQSLANESELQMKAVALPAVAGSIVHLQMGITLRPSHPCFRFRVGSCNGFRLQAANCYEEREQQ